MALRLASSPSSDAASKPRESSSTSLQAAMTDVPAMMSSSAHMEAGVASAGVMGHREAAARAAHRAAVRECRRRKRDVRLARGSRGSTPSTTNATTQRTMYGQYMMTYHRRSTAGGMPASRHARRTWKSMSATGTPCSAYIRKKRTARSHDADTLPSAPGRGNSAFTCRTAACACRCSSASRRAELAGGGGDDDVGVGGAVAVAVPPAGSAATLSVRGGIKPESSAASAELLLLLAAALLLPCPGRRTSWRVPCPACRATPLAMLPALLLLRGDGGGEVEGGGADSGACSGVACRDDGCRVAVAVEAAAAVAVGGGTASPSEEARVAGGGHTIGGGFGWDGGGGGDGGRLDGASCGWDEGVAATTATTTMDQGNDFDDCSNNVSGGNDFGRS